MKPNCAVCKTSSNIIMHWWYTGDSNINLPLPPIDLRGSGICSPCYIDGPTMESRIRGVSIASLSTIYYDQPSGKDQVQVEHVRIYAADGSDGLNCFNCLIYYSYVEPNCPAGYLCHCCR